MSPKAQLESLAQSVYLVIKNRYYDGIDGEDGQVYISQVIDWANMWIDEIENETDEEGLPVEWKWSRANDYTLLDSAAEGLRSFTAPSAIEGLLAEQGRYVRILQDGSPISYFAVVDPRQITNKQDRVTEDMCAMIGNTIVFSRALRDTEAGGSVIGDVTLPLPRLTSTNVKLLTTVKPRTLLVLGIAKNATLPDIVKGQLSPNYAQKYNRLLKGAIARNRKSSLSSDIDVEDFSRVRGIY